MTVGMYRTLIQIASLYIIFKCGNVVIHFQQTFIVCRMIYVVPNLPFDNRQSNRSHADRRNIFSFSYRGIYEHMYHIGFASDYIARDVPHVVYVALDTYRHDVPDYRHDKIYYNITHCDNLDI